MFLLLLWNWRKWEDYIFCTTKKLETDSTSETLTLYAAAQIAEAEARMMSLLWFYVCKPSLCLVLMD